MLDGETRMTRRHYYSRRTGKNPKLVRLDLPSLKRLFLATYSSLSSRGYFAQALGQTCEEGEIVGEVGADIEGFFLRRLRKTGLWPLYSQLESYAEEDLFDVIELLYDFASKPESTSSHGWNSSCVHYQNFNAEAGRLEFREEINQFLHDYETGYELSAAGEVQTRDKGYEALLDARMPVTDPEGVEARVESAVRKFRLYRGSLEDRREAVRLLADVLEYLRPQIKKTLTRQDEADLFNIANNFGIRHHNKSQKTGYDQDIWLRWMFYYYLSTIHAAVRLLAKTNPPSHAR